jgi:hypothetical protein
LYIFAAIEGEGEGGVVFADGEISAGYDTCIIVFSGEIE